MWGNKKLPVCQQLVKVTTMPVYKLLAVSFMLHDIRLDAAASWTLYLHSTVRLHTTGLAILCIPGISRHEPADATSAYTKAIDQHHFLAAHTPQVSRIANTQGLSEHRGHVKIKTMPACHGLWFSCMQRISDIGYRKMQVTSDLQIYSSQQG